MELVDISDLGSEAARCESSSLSGGTIYSKPNAFIGGKNMETLSFAFGVLTVVAVMLVTVVVVGIVKVLKMQKEINSLERWISNTEDSVHTRINQELEHVNNAISDNRKGFDLRIDGLNSYLDSRFDKMENKYSIKKQIIND